MVSQLKKMLKIVVLLHTSYSKESKVEDISDDCIIDFIIEYDFDSFEDVYLECSHTTKFK